MRSTQQKKTFTLSPVDIDELCEWLDEQGTKFRVERQNRIRVRLLTEEILLRMREQMPDDTVLTVSIDAGFRRPRLKIEAPGEPYNPLGTVPTEMGDWDSLLRTAVGLTPQYNYEQGMNVLRLPIPSPRRNSVVLIGAFVVLGIALGTIGLKFIPEHGRQLITDVVFDPLYVTWNRLLNALSGPVIFLTVITTMLSTRGITRRGGNSAKSVARYFVLSILMVLVGVLFSIPLFPRDHQSSVLNRSLVADMLRGILDVVPNNIVQPFMESNTSHLLFLAFVLGYVLIKLDDQVPNLKVIIGEANMVGLRLARWMSMLVPVILGGFLCLELWQSKTGVLMGIWKPFSFALQTSIIVMLVSVLFTSVRMKVSPVVFVKKIWRPFAIACSTGSLDESFGVVQSSCTRLLGIDTEFTREALPQGLVLYMPVSAVGTIVFTLYAAQVFNVQSTTVWFVQAIVMAVVVFVATPPVPGANLLAYVVLFEALGIPRDALIDAMAFDVVFGIFAGAANQAVLQMELVLQARRFGFLNTKLLRKPM